VCSNGKRGKKIVAGISDGKKRGRIIRMKKDSEKKEKNGKRKMTMKDK